MSRVHCARSARGDGEFHRGALKKRVLRRRPSTLLFCTRTWRGTRAPSELCHFSPNLTRPRRLALFYLGFWCHDCLEWEHSLLEWGFSTHRLHLISFKFYFFTPKWHWRRQGTSLTGSNTHREMSPELPETKSRLRY